MTSNQTTLIIVVLLVIVAAGGLVYYVKFRTPAAEKKLEKRSRSKRK